MSHPVASFSWTPNPDCPCSDGCGGNCYISTKWAKDPGDPSFYIWHPSLFDMVLLRTHTRQVKADVTLNSLIPHVEVRVKLTLYVYDPADTSGPAGTPMMTTKFMLGYFTPSGTSDSGTFTVPEFPGEYAILGNCSWEDAYPIDSGNILCRYWKLFDFAGTTKKWKESIHNYDSVLYHGSYNATPSAIVGTPDSDGYMHFTRGNYASQYYFPPLTYSAAPGFPQFDAGSLYKRTPTTAGTHFWTYRAFTHEIDIRNVSSDGVVFCIGTRMIRVGVSGGKWAVACNSAMISDNWVTCWSGATPVSDGRWRFIFRSDNAHNGNYGEFLTSISVYKDGTHVLDYNIPYGGPAWLGKLPDVYSFGEDGLLQVGGWLKTYYDSSHFYGEGGWDGVRFVEGTDFWKFVGADFECSQVKCWKGDYTS